jgi:hypothetical protein
MFGLKKFLLGLKIVPKASTEVDSLGELEVLSSNNKLQFHNGTTVSPVVTEAHSAVLTNKTIDANGTGNSISNIEVADFAAGVVDTDLSVVSGSNDTIPSALATKTYIDNHINDTTGAHAATAISVTPTGNLAADDVQEALQELQGDIDGISPDVADLVTLSGVAANSTTLGTFTGTTIPDSSTVKAALQALETEVELKLDASEVGVSVATLVGGKVPSSQLPNAIMEYKGTYNASTNTPTLADGAGNADEDIGNVYRVTVAGTQDFGAGAITFAVGDYVILNASKIWEKADATDNPDLVSGPASATDNAVARFDLTTGKIIQNSGVIIDDSNVVSGATQLNVDNLRLDGNVISSTDTNGNVDLTPNGTGSVNVNKDARFFQDVAFEITADSTAGANVTLAAPATKIIRLTGAATSIDMIPAGSEGQEIIVVNATGADLNINDNTGATAANRILTGQKATITLKDEASLPLVYDSTEQRWMVAAGVGGGSAGAQVPDVFVQLTGSELISTWSTGDNATFLGGGTLSGTFAYETSSPLNGVQSYKLTQAAGSLNDYVASPVQSVPLRFRGNTVSMFFPYTYNGTSSDIEPIIYDVTNAAKLTVSSNLLPSTGTNASIYKVNVTIPSSCTQIRVGFHVKSLSSGAVLNFDDVQISSDTTKYASTQITEYIKHSAFSNTLLDLTAEVRFDTGNITSTSKGVIQVVDDPSNTRTKFVALKNSAVTVTWSAEVTGAGNALYIYKNGTRITVGSSVYGSTYYGDASWTGTLVTGDYLSVGSSNVVTSDTAGAYLSIVATTQEDSIITASESFSSDTASLVYASSSSYTLSTLSDAPIGTFITFTYGSSSNTRTQTTTAPTQTTSDMNANGILVYTRAFNAASTAAQPAAVAIQVGKNFKGLNLNLYKSSGKVTTGSFDMFFDSTRKVGFSFKDYNESTGILYLDAGYDGTASSTTTTLYYSDITTSTSGYVTVNASKSPALVGVPQVQPRIAYLSDQKASGTAGGSQSATTWNIRVLNTLVDDTGVVTSLSSNQFVLTAGTYDIEASAPTYQTNVHKLRLRNISDSSTALVGDSSHNGGADATSKALLNGRIIITASKTFELQHYTAQANAGANGLGVATSSGEVEVYAQLKIMKIK